MSEEIDQRLEDSLCLVFGSAGQEAKHQALGSDCKLCFCAWCTWCGCAAGSLFLRVSLQGHFSKDEAFGNGMNQIGIIRLFLKLELEELVRLDLRQAMGEKCEGISPMKRQDSRTVLGEGTRVGGG